MTSSIEITNDLYAGLPQEVRQQLAKHGKVVTVPPGTRLLRSGTTPEQLIILNSGSAETFVAVAGKSRSLGISRAGKVFGLHFMLTDAPHDISVTCLEECEVTIVPKKAFLDVLQRHPQMYFAIVQVLATDLSAAHHVIRSYGRGSKARIKV